MVSRRDLGSPRINDLATRMAGAVDGEPAIDVCCAAAMMIAFTLHVAFRKGEQDAALENIIKFLRQLAGKNPGASRVLRGGRKSNG